MAKDSPALLDFFHSYFFKVESVNSKELEEWKNSLFEEGNTCLFEVYQNETILGVFHCTIWEDTIHLDFVYCEDHYIDSVYNEVYSYLKANYKGSTLEYLFYEHEVNIKRFLETNHFQMNIISYDLDYKGYHPIAVSKETKYTVVPFEEKYGSIFKKLKSQISQEKTFTYVILNKHKPIGYIILSKEEKNTIYIEEIRILSKYEKDVKAFCIKSILNNYPGYDISVILSYTDEEEIEFYESVGFEINPKRIFLEATILL